MKLVSTFKTADAIKIIKTWRKGWATSYRLHETPRLPCLFGCAGCKDEFAHYIYCPHLYALNKFFNGEVSNDPLSRLGLVEATTQQLQIVCCYFSGYHALHAHARKQIQHVNSDTPFRLFRQHWSVFAEAFAAEARETDLVWRRFSLCQFINFLANQSSEENRSQLPAPAPLPSEAPGSFSVSILGRGTAAQNQFFNASTD